MFATSLLQYTYSHASHTKTTMSYILKLILYGSRSEKETQCHTVRQRSYLAIFYTNVCCFIFFSMKIFKLFPPYTNGIDLFPPVLTTGSTKAVHVLSCLCDNACKRSLAICHKSRASCPVSRLLSVPIWPACAEQRRKYD